MKKLKKAQKPSLKKQKKPLKIKKNVTANKINKLKTKSKKKLNINIIRNSTSSPVRVTATTRNIQKATGDKTNKKGNNNKKSPTMLVFISAAITGVTLAGIVIFTFIGVHSYREKRYIAETVMQLQEEDSHAFVAANNEYIFFVKDKSVMLKNTDGKVLWEIPILADDFNIIHEEPNLLITYNIDGKMRIERYNNSGELASILIEDKVVDIKINRIGEVIVLTEELGNTYSLKIFNINGELKKEIIRLNAEEFGFPTGISLSPNGTKAAISVVNTTSPIVTSNVSIIDVVSGKTIEGITFRDSIAYDVVFLNETEWEILKN